MVCDIRGRSKGGMDWVHDVVKSLEPDASEQIVSGDSKLKAKDRTGVDNVLAQRQ
jgi:hypothetical protein